MWDEGERLVPLFLPSGLFCCYGIILIVCDWRWDSYRDTTDRYDPNDVYILICLMKTTVGG